MSAPTNNNLLETSLIRWRNNLIDLTRRNPLLSLKKTRSSHLDITAPDIGQVFDHLVTKSKGWTFWLPPAKEQTGLEGSVPEGSAAPAKKKDPQPPKASELVTAESDRQRLVQILTNLYRRMRSDFRERGLHILHLAAGVLEWRDPDDEPMRSPLVLVPVELRRKSLQEPFILEDIEEDPIVNPALVARLLQDHDFRLPAAPEDWEEKPLAAYLDEIDAQIKGLPGWKIERIAFLSLFSFFKGVIFQDLEENAARVKVHNVVQALAGLPAPLKKADLPSERDLDDQQDPAQTYHILDADASQRLCLEAAVRQESFVLIGPPGTGKSQTIANLIADHLARGKRVLFVSEKMAALEVVFQRLRHVGLGDFCLELHSHKASKREVVTELARCYQERAKPGPAGAEDFATLRDRRDQLNRYVRALHAVREPMRHSAWDVLAELPRWNALSALPLGVSPQPPLEKVGPISSPHGKGGLTSSPPLDKEGKGVVVTELTPAQLDDLKQLLQRLQNLWHIRTDAGYPWKGFKADRFTLQLRDEVVGLIDKVRGRIEKLKIAADQFSGKLGIQASADKLLKIGELLDNRPANVPAGWLKEVDCAGIGNDLESCASQYQRLGQARAPLTARYGSNLWTLSPGTAARVEEAWHNAARFFTLGDDKGAALLPLQQKLRGWAADTLKKLPAWLTEIRALEKWLAVPLPLGAASSHGASAASPAVTTENLDPSPHTVKQFLRLAHLAMADSAPERPWVNEEAALRNAQSLIAAQKPVFTAYHERRKRLLTTYKDEFFELELDRIAAGYAGPYLSWFRFFNGNYRQDYRTIRRRTHQFAVPATVAEDVALGRDLLAEKKRLESERPARQGILGRYEKGLDTDWDAADRATRVAVEAIQLVHELGSAALPGRFVDALSASTPPPEKIRAAFTRLNDSYGVWHHATLELKAALPLNELPGAGEALEECAISALLQYARDTQAALNQLGAVTDPVLSRAPAQPPDLATLAADLHQAEELLALEATQETESQRWKERLGAAFQGTATNWDALRKSLTWVRRLRECFKNSASGENQDLPVPPPAFIDLVTGTATLPSVRDVKTAQEQYEQALHGFEVRFDAPGPLLEGNRYQGVPSEIVYQHLNKLRDRAGELSDWIDYRHLPDRFAHLGLADFWESLRQENLAREQVVDVFLKSFWSAWLEAIFHEDPVLSNFRRTEHERVLAEFRELDRKLIREGAARVTRQALEKNTPLAFDAEAAQLMKEAHKKSKHWPLRRLFDTIPNLLLHIKPCLLMSPLSVSQFLPSDPARMQFDVVVFDEASQILPEDALGAIYRGKQVVITGDNQQLPPTTFFQQMAGDVEDEAAAEEDLPLFESILDACLGAGLPQKLLRWHYRSRHEHLIAFSNERYYEGRLVTFPAARAEHPGLGVKFHHVPDSVYDRGGRRDNPREAEVVADLVLDHFRQSPDLTLGVIAFSYPQMNAIEDELDRRLRKEPDLERFFEGDRLEGFFVKNLETVQGDERDVILLSVGYGRDAEGKIALNFGPLNREGGARRLNVAVTRARRKLIVVSSIRAADLGATASDAVGHLRQYLDFAERGMVALRPDEDTHPAGQEPHGLESEVQAVLQKLGYQSVPHVGCGAFRIDLGVVDPAHPGCFVLGIEFDGPHYHQAATARDRDRLRPEVLQQLGWSLHRIWSPDWLYRRQEEIERLSEALRRARA